MIIYFEIEETPEAFPEEGTENETTVSTEPDSTATPEPTPVPTACTYVYSETYEVVCAEDLVQDQGTINNPYYSVVLQDQTDRSTDLTNQTTVISLIEDIKENQETIIAGQDTTELMSIYEDINETLTNVYEFVGVALGLYFVSWIISIFNSWRRNNT